MHMCCCSIAEPIYMTDADAYREWRLCCCSPGNIAQRLACHEWSGYHTTIDLAVYSSEKHIHLGVAHAL